MIELNRSRGFYCTCQIKLQLEIVNGTKPRKTLVEEARTYEAYKLILGTTRHHGAGYVIREPFCAWSWPVKTSNTIQSTMGIFSKLKLRSAVEVILVPGVSRVFLSRCILMC